MPLPTTRIHPRARDLVKEASNRIVNTATKTWLREDPKGTWEILATELLNNEQARVLMAEKGLTEDHLFNEAADLLALRALRAALNVAKKEQATR